ncbi:transmembrane protein [Ceratobasidium sp. AG-Ba]|nr:transmembrane protein [Ceratobasidium sp. AG-Ba]
MKIWTLGNYTTGCEPAALLTASTYQTPNGAFRYTVKSLYDTGNKVPTSNSYYNGSLLENCWISSIAATGNFVIQEANLEATANCSLSGNIEMVITTNYPITLKGTFEHVTNSLDSDSRRASWTSDTVFNLLVHFSSDLVTWMNFAPASSNAFYDDFRFNTSGAVKFSSGGADHTPGATGLIQEWPMDSRGKNLAYIFASCVLTDLGVGTSRNMLTSVESFHHYIEPTQNYSVANELLSGKMEEYSLPFTFVRPALFNAYYLCHYISWKPPTSLLIDVFVSTVSIFMVFWAALNLGLRFWAQKTSENGDHCVCANCKKAFSENDVEGVFGRFPPNSPSILTCSTAEKTIHNFLGGPQQLSIAHSNQFTSRRSSSIGPYY